MAGKGAFNELGGRHVVRMLPRRMCGAGECWGRIKWLRMGERRMVCVQENLKMYNCRHGETAGKVG